MRFLFILSFIFLNFDSITWSNDIVEQYNKVLIKGDQTEKLETAQKII